MDFNQDLNSAAQELQAGVLASTERRARLGSVSRGLAAFYAHVGSASRLRQFLPSRKKAIPHRLAMICF